MLKFRIAKHFPGAMVSLDKLFGPEQDCPLQERTENMTFMQMLREQHLRDIINFMDRIQSQIQTADATGKGRVMPHQLRSAIKNADPYCSSKQLTELMARGMGMGAEEMERYFRLQNRNTAQTGSTESSTRFVHVEGFMSRLKTGLVRPSRMYVLDAQPNVAIDDGSNHFVSRKNIIAKWTSVRSAFNVARVLASFRVKKQNEDVAAVAAAASKAAGAYGDSKGYASETASSERRKSQPRSLSSVVRRASALKVGSSGPEPGSDGELESKEKDTASVATPTRKTSVFGSLLLQKRMFVKHKSVGNQIVARMIAEEEKAQAEKLRKRNASKKKLLILDTRRLTGVRKFAENLSGRSMARTNLLEASLGSKEPATAAVASATSAFSSASISAGSRSRSNTMDSTRSNNSAVASCAASSDGESTIGTEKASRRHGANTLSAKEEKHRLAATQSRFRERASRRATAPPAPAQFQSHVERDVGTLSSSSSSDRNTKNKILRSTRRISKMRRNTTVSIPISSLENINHMRKIARTGDATESTHLTATEAAMDEADRDFFRRMRQVNTMTSMHGASRSKRRRSEALKRAMKTQPSKSSHTSIKKSKKQSELSRRRSSKHKKSLLLQHFKQQTQAREDSGIDQDPVTALARRQSARRRTTAFLPGLSETSALSSAHGRGMPARSLSDIPRRKSANFAVRQKVKRTRSMRRSTLRAPLEDKEELSTPKVILNVGADVGKTRDERERAGEEEDHEDAEERPGASTSLIKPWPSETASKSFDEVARRSAAT